MSNTSVPRLMMNLLLKTKNSFCNSVVSFRRMYATCIRVCDRYSSFPFFSSFEFCVSENAGANYEKITHS